MTVMTEEEAKGKWCPFARVSEIGERGGAYTHAPNRNLSEPREAASWCLASQCMAWRWTTTTHYRRTELWSKSKGCRVNSAWSDDADWRPVEMSKDADPPPAVGYCGLAGTPTP